MARKKSARMSTHRDHAERWFTPTTLLLLAWWLVYLAVSHARACIATLVEAVSGGAPVRKEGRDEALHRIVVLTGASSGLGKHVSEAILRQFCDDKESSSTDGTGHESAGSIMLICGVRREDVGMTEERLQKISASATGRHILVRVIEVDLSDYDSVMEFARRSKAFARRSNAIDLLVNNAAEFPGTSWRTAPAGEEAPFAGSVPDAVYVNTIAPWLLMRALQPLQCCNVVSFVHRAVMNKSRFVRWMRAIERARFGTSASPRASQDDEDDTCADETFEPSLLYMYTKLALILVSIHWHERGLASSLPTRPHGAPGGGGTVTLFDPGAIDSQLTRRWPASLRFLQRFVHPNSNQRSKEECSSLPTPITLSFWL